MNLSPRPTAFSAFVVTSLRVVCIRDLNVSFMGLNNDVGHDQFTEFMVPGFRLLNVRLPIGVSIIDVSFAELVR